MVEHDPRIRRPVASSAGRFMGFNTIYGRDGDDDGPYMTRIWFWRLRLHIFHRGDLDEDCHDHPFNFWTFPLTSYVEEVALPVRDTAMLGQPVPPERFYKIQQIVPAFRWSFRPATHCHRVLGAWDGTMRNDHTVARVSLKGSERWARSKYWPGVDQGRKIITLVWISKRMRAWGFLKNREGKWCWVAWRDYVFNGGKEGPCQ